MPSSRRTLASLSSTTRILALRISAALTTAFAPIRLVRPRLFCEFQRPIQRIHELIDLDGFGEIAEKSRKQALLDVAGHGIRTERHYRNVRGGRIFTEDFQGFYTADARQ